MGLPRFRSVLVLAIPAAVQSAERPHAYPVSLLASISTPSIATRLRKDGAPGDLANLEPFVLMLDGECEEVDVRCFGMLAVVASLEVARRSVELVGAECREVAVDGNLQLVLVVLDLVSKLCAYGNVAEVGADFVAAGTSLLNADVDVAVVVVEELTDGFGGDAIVDVDLADDGLIPRSFNCNGCLETVGCSVGIPTGGVAGVGVHLAKLCATVAGVGCGDAIHARVLHHHGAVTAFGKEVMVTRVLVAVLQLGTRDGGGIARRANG